MALGSAGGCGGSSSSSSNLSALAPPFTVVRFNPKPNSNPRLNFTDMPYAAAAPFGHTWQYIQHSETRPDVFPKPELVVDDLTRTTCMPVSNECHYSVSASVSPSSTQWFGLNPGVSMPLSNDYHYSVSESVNPSSTQWCGPPFGQNWQYHSPHVSEPRSDVFHKPKLDVDDSTRTTSMPLANDYRYSVSKSINPSSTQWSGLNLGAESSSNAFYVAEGKPYCPGYVSSVVCEDNPLVSLSESGSGPLSASGLENVSSQVDYTVSLSGLEYVPQWGGVWNGLAEAKRGKQVESGGSFSFEKVHDGAPLDGAPLVYKNCMSQGPAVESGDVSRGDSDISYGKSTDGIRRESYPGSFNVKNTDDKSLFAQELGSGIFYGKSADGIGKESCTGSLSAGNVNNEFVYAQKLGFLPFESSGTQFLGSSSPFSESQPPYPLQESSKNLFNYQKKYGAHETFVQPLDPFVQDSASFVKPSRAVVIRAPVNGASSPAQEPVTHEAVGTGNVTNVCTKLLDSPNPLKSKEPHVLTSPENIGGSFNTSKLDMGKELLSKTQNGDSIDTTLKRKSVSHVTDTNISPGLSLSLDHVQPFKYPENPSDSLDNPNPAVDSPCWRGAPASHYSPLDVVETKEKLEGSYDLDANGNHIARRGNGSTAADYQKQFEENADKKIGCTGNDMASYPKSTSDSNCPAKEHRLADGGINFNDALEGGSVAYHAAENVLCSPSAQENSLEHHQPSGREATLKIDVQTLINAIHNLSEVLHFSCSADSCGLKEQDQEVLKHVISNLEACMSEKIVNSTPALEPMFSHQGTSDKTEELHDLHAGKFADKPRQRYQGTMKSYGQRDHQYMHTENINFSESGKRAEYMPHFLPLVDDVQISRDEDMVQAIKKVLDENFNFEEEMQSQSLLYKNLWLEAEAKLCSISYKARFDRLRILIDKDKSSRKKEIAADMDKVPGSNNTPGSKETFSPASLAEDGSVPEGTVANHSTFSTNSHADDGEASVLDRFDMLRRQDEKSNSKDEQQPDMVDNGKAEGQFRSSIGGFDPEGTITNHSTFRNHHADDVESSVLAKFNMLRCRDDKSNPEEQQQPDMVDARKTEGLFGSSIGGFDPEGLFGSSIGGFDPEGTITNHSTSRNNHAGYNMLGCRDDKLNPEEQQQQNVVDTRKAEGQFESSVGGFGPEDTISSHSTFSKIGHADDVEASVLARFNILKCRDDKYNTEEQQLSDLVDARKAEGQYGSYIGVSGYESIKEFYPSLANGPVLKPNRTVSFGNEHPLVWFDNSSSDWEHVLKDDFTWQK